MLGFAARSRGCVSGYTAVESGVRKKKILLVILDEGISSGSREKIKMLCRANGVPYVTVRSAEEMGRRIGKPAVKVAGITQRLFAQRMLQLIEKSVDDRTEVED